jgi:hypothetical protein
MSNFTDFKSWEITSMTTNAENTLQLGGKVSAISVSTPIALYVASEAGLLDTPNAGDKRGRFKIPASVARWDIDLWQSDKVYFKNQVLDESSNLIVIEGIK